MYAAMHGIVTKVHMQGFERDPDTKARVEGDGDIARSRDTV